MHKISIIIPVYNDEEHLRRSVDSVVSQDGVEKEIILVDDGSRDSSPELCDEYAEKYPFIKVIHKENGGAASARNLGIKESSGDYIFFVDGDDSIDEGCLKKLLDKALENGADLVVGNFRQRNDDGSIRKCYELPEYVKNKVISEYDFWRLNSESSTYVLSVVWAKLYSRKIWEKVKFPEGVIHEDEFVMHKIASNSGCIYVMDEIVYSQFLAPNSVMRQAFSFKNLAAAKARAERTQYLIEKQYYDMALFNFGFGTRTLLIGYDTLHDRESKKAIGELYREFKVLANRLKPHVAAKNKVRLILFNLNLGLYGKVRNLLSNG